jgi:hypothetical protein
MDGLFSLLKIPFGIGFNQPFYALPDMPAQAQQNKSFAIGITSYSPIRFTSPSPVLSLITVNPRSGCGIGAGLAVLEIPMNTTYSITAKRGDLCADANPVPISRKARRSELLQHRRRTRFFHALLAASVLTIAAPEKPDMKWSGLGHGKRYLRINEYLFNGTQKVTAIAWWIGTDAPGNTLT